VTDARTQLVADGYDAIGDTFAEWRELIVGDPREEWEAAFVARLEDGARILELGCGPGTVETKRLAERFQLTGVDISPKQIERARAAIPEAEFVCSDFTELELRKGSLDGVIAFYTLNHVPRELLAPLLRSAHEWLAPDGVLCVAFGVSDNPGWTGEWLGAPTFFASFPAETNSRLVGEAGFTIERDEIVEFTEPEGPDEGGGSAQFQWVLARA